MYSQPTWAVTVQNPQAHQDRDCPPGGLFGPSLGRWAAYETGLPSASAWILTFLQRPQRAQPSGNHWWTVQLSMEQPHIHQLRSVLIRQLSRSYLGGWISFHLTGALCPETCRSVDTPTICCNRRNLGEMLKNEGWQQSLLYKSVLYTCINTNLRYWWYYMEF